MQQRQAEAIDADVVVFPITARRAQFPALALARIVRLRTKLPVAVDQVGLGKQRAFPFRGLLQQMPPGDRLILRGGELIIQGRLRHPLIHIADQAVRDGQSGQDGKVAFGNRKSHVGAHHIAPGRGHPAPAQNHTGRAAAWLGRAQHLVPGRRFELPLAELIVDIPGPGDFVGEGERHRVSQTGWRKTGALRFNIYCLQHRRSVARQNTVRANSPKF